MVMDEELFCREALLQEGTGDEVRCLTCERRCRIEEGGRGWCRTRRNEGGRIYTLIYGRASSISLNPIEKKPLYHFYPGSFALTAGSFGCNFSCPWCQNWQISKSPPVGGRFISAESFVEQTLAVGGQGTSISFNEPTLSSEWSLEVFRSARERGLYNTYVTNGYMTEEALELLVESGLDAMNVDIKGSREAVWRHCGADVEMVWRNCQRAKERGVHIEVTTLVIPTVNDDEESLRGIAARVRHQLGEDTPWHVSRYHPAYKFEILPTSLAALERAWEIGKEEGLEFIYVGNVFGHPRDNTYCPSCGELLIHRRGFDIVEYRLSGDRCPACGRVIPLVGSFVPR